MESLYLLIPMSLAVVALIVFILYWSVRNGQFEDLEGPAHAILMDDDIPKSSPSSKEHALSKDE
jgi:cbb3-type cytochrome oxidase maturation protein